jgi:anti-sigma B factor antagonist
LSSFAERNNLYPKHQRSMKYSIDKQERYAILKLEEENLNSLIAPSLKSEFVILANEGINNLILDLSDVKYVDSSGLSAILKADRLWKSLGSFILTGLDYPNVRKLIEISRLDSVLTILPTVSESIDFVFMEEIERELNGDPDDE